MERPRFSLRYLMFDVFLWALALAIFLERESILTSLFGAKLSPFAATAAFVVWFAIVGAAIGGLLGRMAWGAALGPIPYFLFLAVSAAKKLG